MPPLFLIIFLVHFVPVLFCFFLSFVSAHTGAAVAAALEDGVTLIVLVLAAVDVAFYMWILQVLCRCC
jgi:hypothetical protein